MIKSSMDLYFEERNVLQYSRLPKNITESLKQWDRCIFIWLQSEMGYSYREIADMIQQKYNITIDPSSLPARKRRVTRYINKEGGRWLLELLNHKNI